MPLPSAHIRQLRSQAHARKPVLRIGNKGLTDNVLLELERALNDHELIKVAIAGLDREQRREVTNELCARSGAELVQIIGRISVLYRVAPPAR